MGKVRDNQLNALDLLIEQHDEVDELIKRLEEEELEGQDKMFVFFELAKPELRMPFLDALSDEGVLMIDYPGGDRVRAVTHYGIESADIDAAIEATRRALATVGLAPARTHATAGASA